MHCILSNCYGYCRILELDPVPTESSNATPEPPAQPSSSPTSKPTPAAQPESEEFQGHDNIKVMQQDDIVLNINFEQYFHTLCTYRALQMK